MDQFVEWLGTVPYPRPLKLALKLNLEPFGAQGFYVGNVAGQLSQSPVAAASEYIMQSMSSFFALRPLQGSAERSARTFMVD